MKKALTGIRIVEVGPYMALPLTGRILASHGAEVIKIDSHMRLDDMYFVPAWAPGCGQPEYQAMKKRITLNLREPEGRKILLRLLEISDVFMTNIRKQTLSEWGFELEPLTERYRELIILWQGGFGGRGPYVNYKLYGNLVQHVSGITAMTGYPDSAPTAVNTSYADWHCGVLQAMVIIGALERRRRTGKGLLVETGIYPSGVVTVGPALLDIQANGRLPQAMGNKDPYMSPHGVYPCKGDDEYCAICVSNDMEWEGLCKVLDMHNLLTDRRFATMVDRVHNADELDVLISARTVEYSKGDLMRRLQAAGIGACLVSKGKDLFESEHLKSHNFYQEVPYYIADPNKPGQDWETSSHTTLAWSTPMRLSETPWEVGSYHKIGEDNHYVYHELLGIPLAEVKALTDKGVLI